MRKGFPRYLVMVDGDGAPGGGSDPKTSEGDDGQPDKAAGDDGKKPDGDVLGDGGKKALKAERDARAASDREAATLRTSLDQATKERDEAVAERDALRLTQARTKAAVEAGLPMSLADRLKGDTAEALKADAAALKTLMGSSPGATVLPPDPSQGRDSAGNGPGGTAAGRDLFNSIYNKKNSRKD